MKKAFTLAEVLLTLGIIGIVAAITIPTLTKAYQRKVLEVQAKKSYSLLNQALQMTLEDNGAEYKCFTTNNSNESETIDYAYSQCLTFWDDYLKHLKTVGEKSSNKSFSYKTKAKVLAEGGSVSNNSCSFSSGYNGQFTKYYLSDGQILYLPPQQQAVGPNILFTVLDINGETGPNKWGYDVFYITPSKRKNGSIRMYESECYIKEKDGKYLSEIIFNKPSTKWLFPD